MSALKNRKVIITDDSPVNLLITGKMLQMAGAEVLKASGGWETIELLKHHKDIGMVFLDLEMPEINGFDTAQLIRKSDWAYADIPLIALSAADDSYTRQKAKDAGLDHYLTKPLSKQLVDSFANELSTSANNQTEYMDTINFNDPDVFNLDYLKMVTGEDEDMKQELAMHIIIDSPVLIASAVQAATRNDWSAVGEDLHKLKGQLGILSMKKTIDTIVQLENFCQNPNKVQEKIKSGLSDIQYTIPLIFNYIKQKIGK